MDLNRMIRQMKQHPAYPRMGMIATHLGVVRARSRAGESVTGIEVRFRETEIKKIIKNIKSMNGIYEVLVQTSEGHLAVGDEIMAVAVGGDIREHVFPALVEAVNRIKAEASRKREFSSRAGNQTGAG